MSSIRLGELRVNRLGFGAMRVIDNDNIWGEPSDRKRVHQVLRRAVELGVNFFDTAESYGLQTDKILIAEALHPYPRGFVIATKCGLSRPSPGRWDADCRPEKIRRDLEGGLKRLKLEAAQATRRQPDCTSVQPRDPVPVQPARPKPQSDQAIRAPVRALA